MEKNRSIRGYLGSFLDAARLTLVTEYEIEPRFHSLGYDLPLSLRVAIRANDKERSSAEFRLDSILVLCSSRLHLSDTGKTRRIGIQGALWRYSLMNGIRKD